jgi:RHS repeat-associated protein
LVKTALGETRYTFDERNWLDTVIAASGTTDYDYNAIGNLVHTHFGNGTEENRQYDDLNRLKYLENKEADGDMISSYTYTLDKVGNRQSVIENDGRTVNYTYDELYRLTQEEVLDAVNGDRTASYVYDNVGNRLTKTDSVEGTTTYTYDNNDRLLAEKVDGQVKISYTYDDNGNTLTKTEPGQQTNYTWDDQNRLVAADIITPTGTKHLEYEYDTSGIRVASKVDGQETRYLIDANQPYAQVLEEYTTDGTVLTAYVYGNDLLSQTQYDPQTHTGSTTYYHVDGLGSTTALTDETGTVVSTSRYDVFGEKTGGTGDVTNKYLFAGEQYDSNLGDYYLRARYYDSEIGRFTRRDIYEGNLEEPLTLNKYTYTLNNPINGIDPTGFFTITEVSQRWVDEANKLAQQATKGITVVDKFRKVSQSTIELIKAVAATYASALEVAESLSRIFKIPMLVIGWEMPQTSAHISRGLLWSGYTSTNTSGSIFGSKRLSPVLSRVPDGTNGNTWYHKLSVYKKRPAGTSIDEYPYESTAQGGATNYNQGLVSLTAVPVKEQQRQGGIMKNFYRRGQIGDGGLSDVTSWYLNFAHFGSMSYMIDRGGNKHFFSFGT